MRIRSFGATEIVIDLIHTTVEIGELAKMAMLLNYRAHIEPAWDTDVNDGYQVRMTRAQDASDWGENEVINFAMMVAYVNGQSGQQMLDKIKHGMEIREFPLDKPLQDVMSIGAGPDHEGHRD